MGEQKMLRGLALAAAVALALPAASRAASIDWDNESGDGQWETPTNWSTNTVPAAPDDAVFINPAAGPAIIDNDVPQVRDIRFGDENRTGSGTVNHNAGTASLTGWFRMGIAAGSGGTYNLSGGNLNINGRVFIAEQDNTTGTLNLTGGTLTYAAAGGNEGLFVASGAGTTATVSVGGGATLTQGTVADPNNGDSWNRVGNNGAATFNVTGGTVSFDARTLFGAGGSSVATITQSGGTVETRRGQIDIADTGDATYTISGGTLRKGGTDGDGFVVGQWTGSNGTLNVQGNANVISDMRMIVGHGDPNAAPNTAVGIVNQDGGTVTVTDELSLGRNVSGNGTYNLNGGTLDMTGSNIERGLGTGTFNFAGGRLVNLGSTNFPLVQAGGTLAPGEAGATGVSTIGGDYTQEFGGTYEVNVGPGGFGDSDVLNVSGTATLAGLLDVVAPAGLNVGDTFTILNAATVSGFFSDAPPNVAFVDDGYEFTATYNPNSVQLTVTAIVPEPAALGLIGLAAGGLLLLRRRRPAR